MSTGREQREEVLWDLHQQSDLVPLEFTEENKPELFGIEPEKAQDMVKGLSVTIAERQVLKDAYIDVIQLEINAENLPVFKELRLKFVKIRTSIDKWHKTNKAFYLAGGRFVDAIKNKEIAETEEIEAKLMAAEKFFENQEKQKAKALNDLRISKIAPYVENSDQMDFKDFSDEDFEDFVFGKKVKHEQRIEAERAEAETIENERIAKEKEIEAQRLENIELKRIADEKELALKLEREANEKKAQAEQKERERLAKIESDKLAKERAESEAKIKSIQDEADKKAREEKAKQETILKAEQEAKAKIEAELQAKKDAEIKAENERIAKDKSDKLEADKLAKAPIKKQLTIWIESFEMPLAPIANSTSIEISEKFVSFRKWAKSEIEKL